MNILVSDLSLDVYFRSGSVDIEKFYPARLSAIANLINSMENLELHLDGYTDRRGDKDENIALANTRIERVREQLINAGVSPDRIVSKAFGEAKMKSAAGNLDAYTFDRRVVIRFERINNVYNNMSTVFLNDEAIVNEKNSDLSDTDNSDTGISETVASATIEGKTAKAVPLEDTNSAGGNSAGADITNRF